MQSKPPGAAHLSLTMAALCGVGGVMGLLKGSPISAVAGAALATAFGAAAHKIREGAADEGYRVAMYSSSFLSGTMVFRYVRTRALMPAGALAVLGAGGAAYHYNKLLELEE